MSFSLAVRGAKLFIKNTAAAIASAGPNSDVPLSQALREELMHWCFVDTWEDHVPCKEERNIFFFLCPMIPLALFREVIFTFQIAILRLEITGIHAKPCCIFLLKKCRRF